MQLIKREKQDKEEKMGRREKEFRKRKNACFRRRRIAFLAFMIVAFCAFVVHPVIEDQFLMQRDSMSGPSEDAVIPSSVANRPHSSGGNLRNDGSAGADVVKPSSNTTTGVYDEQITELKLSVDSLEKGRNLYLSKLRDIEFLCPTSKIENSPIVAAMKKIVYVAEAQAMVAQQLKNLSSLAEVLEKNIMMENRKMKSVPDA